MENNKINQELVQNKIIPCCWSEVNEKGEHITQCPNTPTFRDEDNHQIRYFCKEHMKKVKEIRYQMYLKMKEKYDPNSNIIYLMKYKVSYIYETKYKAFRTFEEATKFHRNYKHHILNNDSYTPNQKQEAFITHFEIIVLDLGFIQTVKGNK